MKAVVFDADDLRQLAEREARPLEELERDFLLVSIAGDLAATFPDELCFKGGFVLRQVLGQRRLSKDIDATRIKPSQHKLDAGDVARAISASARQLSYRVKVYPPATDSGRGLDFDRIVYQGPCGGSGTVAVEVSYREAVILPPLRRLIGGPFYEPFPVPTMQDSEMVSEKVRTLIQRRRPSDLDDLAFIYRYGDVDDDSVKQLLPEKLKLVQPGAWFDRLKQNVESMRRQYEQAMRALMLDPLPYEEAVRIVMPRVARYR